MLQLLDLLTVHKNAPALSSAVSETRKRQRYCRAESNMTEYDVQLV